MIQPTLTEHPGDVIDYVLGLTGGEVLRPPVSRRGGEYDAYRSAGRQKIRRLSRAGLIRSKDSQPADVLADMVGARGGLQMTGDELCAWYIDSCVNGLDERASWRRTKREQARRERAHYDEQGQCDVCGIRPVCDCNRKAPRIADPNRLSDKQLRVLKCLLQAGERGLTDFQYPLGRAEQTASGVRRKELRRAGLVEFAGRRPNDIGRIVDVWRITNSGAAAVERAGRATRRTAA